MSNQLSVDSDATAEHMNNKRDRLVEIFLIITGFIITGISSFLVKAEEITEYQKSIFVASICILIFASVIRYISPLIMNKITIYTNYLVSVSFALIIFSFLSLIGFIKTDSNPVNSLTTEAMFECMLLIIWFSLWILFVTLLFVALDDTFECSLKQLIEKYDTPMSKDFFDSITWPCVFTVELILCSILNPSIHKTILVMDFVILVLLIIGVIINKYKTTDTNRVSKYITFNCVIGILLILSTIRFN